MFYLYSAGKRKKRAPAVAKPGDGPTTGLIVSSDGYVLTSTFNLITRPPVITVIRDDGSRHVATLVARDDDRRLCLLKVNDVKNWPVAATVSDASLKVGQWAVTVGLGNGNQPSISAGIVSAKNRIGGRAVQTNANISPVNYGGALLDIDGRVIGICVPLSPRSTNAADGVAHEGYGGWTWQRFVSHYEPAPDGTHRKRSGPKHRLGANTHRIRRPGCKAGRGRCKRVRNSDPR